VIGCRSLGAEPRSAARSCRGYTLTAQVRTVRSHTTTPHEIIEKLNNEINAVLTEAKNRKLLADLGGTGMLGSPADFGKFIAEETEKWAKVIKFASIKPV
jgi:tripartite-type tricarboxylate transporter receptor subunit TctC